MTDGGVDLYDRNNQMCATATLTNTDPYFVPEGEEKAAGYQKVWVRIDTVNTWGKVKQLVSGKWSQWNRRHIRPHLLETARHYPLLLLEAKQIKVSEEIEDVGWCNVERTKSDLVLHCGRFTPERQSVLISVDEMPGEKDDLAFLFTLEDVLSGKLLRVKCYASEYSSCTKSSYIQVDEQHLTHEWLRNHF